MLDRLPTSPGLPLVGLPPDALSYVACCHTHAAAQQACLSSVWVGGLAWGFHTDALAANDVSCGNAGNTDRSSQESKRMVVWQPSSPGLPGVGLPPDALAFDAPDHPILTAAQQARLSSVLDATPAYTRLLGLFVAYLLHMVLA